MNHENENVDKNALSMDMRCMHEKPDVAIIYTGHMWCLTGDPDQKWCLIGWTNDGGHSYA